MFLRKNFCVPAYAYVWINNADKHIFPCLHPDLVHNHKYLRSCLHLPFIMPEYTKIWNHLIRCTQKRTPSWFLLTPVQKNARHLHNFEKMQSSIFTGFFSFWVGFCYLGPQIVKKCISRQFKPFSVLKINTEWSDCHITNRLRHQAVLKSYKNRFSCIKVMHKFSSC